MKKATERRAEEIDEEDLADLPPELRRAALEWIASGLVSVAAVLAFAAFMRDTADSLVRSLLESGRVEIVESLRRAITSGSTLGQWVSDELPRIEALFAPGSQKIRLLAETSVLMGEAAGQYAHDFGPRNVLAEPYWMYLTMADDRVRPKHRELHGKVFRKNDRFAERFLPPWDWGCRCRARSLSKSDVDSMGVSVTSGSAVPFMVTAGGKQIGLPSPVFNRSRVEALVPDEFTKSLATNIRR